MPTTPTAAKNSFGVSARTPLLHFLYRAIISAINASGHILLPETISCRRLTEKCILHLMCKLRESSPSPIWQIALTLSLYLIANATAQDKAAFKPLPFKVELNTVLEHDDGKSLWFQPRVAVVPKLGKDGQPAVFLTLQKLLGRSDYFSGLSVMRTNDLGKTWSDPDLRPELEWIHEGKVDIAVADVTPDWHPQTGKVLAIGAQVRYSVDGHQLDDIKRAHQTSYAVLDPNSGKWTKWQQINMPDDEQFDYARSACGQFLVEKDGSVLLPFYIGTNSKTPWSITVARFSFDGSNLKYIEHGNVMPLNEGRGFYEPSLIKFQGRYLLTIRSNDRAYVTSGSDGLNYDPPKAWTFDDGKELGSYNTQQHWMAHSDGLFLLYTRRGANNDHIARHRAPLFIAQVDPAKLHVVRSTEQVLVPERGAMMGNFGATNVTTNESWAVVCEHFRKDEARKRGAKGALFVSRVIWSKPNRLIKSD